MDDAVTLAEAKEHLEVFVARAAAGQVVRIEVPGQGAVQLTKAATATDRPSRPLLMGQWRGLANIPVEQLFEPLSDEELTWLSGESSP
jgi:antitoxin (DNA-binding transcriptional repressor) of toxin-antitoxin stability system